MEEWEHYKVRPASALQKGFSYTLSEFSVVSHTSHVDPSLNICIDGGVKPGLVFDKSQLNKIRIQVGWLSPNHWNDGFRYGNIKFDFKFHLLITGKNFYWVESITSYSPHACRILITDQDRSALLKPYDPTLRDGPWWHDTVSDRHYFNGNFCLEFMFEDKIELSALSGFSFVRHHPGFCSVHRFQQSKCDQLGNSASYGGAKFLLKAAAGAIDLSTISKFFVEKNNTYTNDILSAIAKIPELLPSGVRFGGPIDIFNIATQGLARSVINATICNKRVEAEHLMNLFDDEYTFYAAVAEVIYDTLQVGDFGSVAEMLDL